MRHRVLGVLTCVLLLPATLQVTLSASSASPGSVRPPSERAAGGWTPVSGLVHSSALPGLARLDGELQVVWSQTDADGRSIRARLLDSDGAVASPITTVVGGWPAIVNDPKVIGPASTRRTVFAGIHPDPFSAYTGPAVYAESSDGSAWTLGNGSLSQTTAAGSGTTAIAAIDAEGTAFFAKGGFSGGVIVHRGVDTTIPATSPDLRATALEGAPVEVALARDRSGGDVYVAWYSLGATQDDQAGTFVQRIWPQPNGSLLKAPGSSNGSARSIGGDQPVALAERAGGGVWLAYHVGHPTSSTIRLWRAGSASHLDVSSGTASDRLCLTPSTDGRLWLSWRTQSDHRLHAVRSNTTVTSFGPVRHLTQPGGLTSSVWLTTCEGSLGPLSLVVNAQPSSDSPRLYARQVLPPLSAKRRPMKLNAGKVRVAVTDAGDPVAGATVKFRRTTSSTNARGKATVVIGKAVRSKRYTIRIKKPGYASTAVKVRVT